MKNKWWGHKLTGKDPILKKPMKISMKAWNLITIKGTQCIVLSTHKFFDNGLRKPKALRRH